MPSKHRQQTSPANIASKHRQQTSPWRAGSTSALKFGRDARNRIQNHKEGGIADVYDLHGYADENKRIMEAVAAHIMGLVEGRADDKVVPLRR